MSKKSVLELDDIKESKHYKEQLMRQYLYLQSLPLCRCTYIKLRDIRACSTVPFSLFCTEKDLRAFYFTIIKDSLRAAGLSTDEILVKYINDQNTQFFHMVDKIFRCTNSRAFIFSKRVKSTIREIRTIDFDMLDKQQQQYNGDSVYNQFMMLPDEEKMHFFKRLGRFHIEFVSGDFDSK